MAISGERLLALFALIACACVMTAVPHTMATITCDQAIIYVFTCIGYVQTGGTPPDACCSGVRELHAVSNTTAECQAACKCVVDLANKIPGLQPDLMKSLPSKCGVNLPFVIGPDTDCSKIKLD